MAETRFFQAEQDKQVSIKDNHEVAYISIENESRMCLAIIMQALRDLSSPKEKIAKEARFWFDSMDSGTYTLIDCCSAMSKRLRTMGRDIEISPYQVRKKCLSEHEAIVKYKQKPDREASFDYDLLSRNYLSKGYQGVTGSVMSFISS